MPSSTFGPVNSRRFGISLGVDLSPAYKQCNFDCLYCELAPAPAITEQMQSISIQTILDDLKTSLQTYHDVDVITITANGEPTLYPDLDDLITHVDMIKGQAKTLILSNAAALVDQKIFDILLRFDQVKLSLDAATPHTFKKIDRPAPDIHIEEIIDAIQRFSVTYTNMLFIEILFVHTVNDSQEEIEALNHALQRIRCTRIDIGTIDRPPAYPVEALSYETMHRIARQFDASLPIHIASRSSHTMQPESYDESSILNTLDKRPLTMEDMQQLFDAPTLNRLNHLIEHKKIITETIGNITFYLPHDTLLAKRRKRH